LGQGENNISEIQKYFRCALARLISAPEPRDQPGGCSSLLRSHPSMFFDALVPFAHWPVSRELSSVWSREALDFRCILDLSVMTLSLRYRKNAPDKTKGKVTSC
jgi:hypothetical protein